MAATSEGFAVQRADQTLRPGMDLVDAVLDNIRSADVVVALIREDESPWLWFEVGGAVALNRPLVVVLTSSRAKLPSNLSSLLTVGPIVSSDAIRIALKRAAKATTRLPTSPVKPTGVPLGTGASELLNRLDNLGGEGVQFESWFAEVLDRAHVPYDQSVTYNEQQEQSSLFGIDFVVTANELEGNLGNPLPVELKTRGSFSALFQSRQQTFASYLSATGARTLLLVALNGIDEPQLLPLPAGGLLACDARHLVRLMADETFGQAVIALRNQAVHDGGYR